jgi:tetratricopeptide (TPR) repeat protein
MRPRAAAALVIVLVSSACAARVIPAPVVTTPRFPDFIRPAVPPAYADSPVAGVHDRAWAFLQAGDLRNAERETAIALRARPEFYPAETTAGFVELARKAPKEAIVRFDRTLAREPADVAALTGRGHALVALEREGEALAAYEAALVADPGLTDLRRRVEVMRFRAIQEGLARARAAAEAGDAAEAITAYQAAIASSPESAFLYRELAAVERRGGNVDAALEHYRQAIALEPADAASRVSIAGILEERGDLEGALGTYDEALALEPNAEVAERRDSVRERVELARLPAEYRVIGTASEVSRADLAALIGVRLAPLLIGQQTSEPGVVTDVRGNWAEQWIMSTVRAGVIEAFANHTFQPRTVVRRVDLAQAVSRLLPRIVSPAQLRTWQAERAKFADVSPGHLAYPAASLAVASGIMRTMAGGAFEPSQIVTGAEASEIIERLREMAQLTAAPSAGV